MTSAIKMLFLVKEDTLSLILAVSEQRKRDFKKKFNSYSNLYYANLSPRLVLIEAQINQNFEQI